MKRTGIDHPKTKRLAKLLSAPHFTAVGLLECLWHFAARHAIRGDIGRWSDDEIADAVGWPADDAGRLVTALVDAGWLDRCQQHRLVVHDWSDHCDESTKKTVQRKGWEFAKAIAVVATEEACRDLSRHVETSSAVVATCLDSQSQSLSQSRSQSQSLFLSPDGASEKGRPVDSSKSDSEKPDTKSTSPKFNDEDVAIAREMFDGIKAIQPNARPPNLDHWANEMRLLRSDGQDRSAETIRATLAWVRQDPFWKSNILSPAKLRKHWDTLQLKRSSPNERTRTRGPVIGPGQTFDPNAAVTGL